MAVRLARASKQPLIAAAAFGAIDVDDHVADFAGGVIEPGIKFAIDDQPAANAGANENADDIFGFAFQLGLMNAQNGNVAVVLDEDRNAQLLLQLLLQRNIFPPSRLGAKMTVPASGSTAPGAPMPIAANCFSSRSRFIHGVPDAASMRSMTASDAALGFGADLGGAEHSETN